ncbi:hypothetical protein QYE76_058653 [Lolium multiflorum]|uniref:Auxin response factor n=1 Tax=Lolium multiflorum TaxID=4521 RepID=A0AAD8WPV7_LOLMU|nr:hypothetical protein QYE76_058653 [Lolium multiflorum]
MPAAAMASPQTPSAAGDPLFDELWHACAGPLVTVPRVGDFIFYFPQGHIEQAEASMNQVAGNQMRLYDLPSKLLCRVINVELKVDTASVCMMVSKRIQKEIKDLQKDPPTSCNADLPAQDIALCSGGGGDGEWPCLHGFTSRGMPDGSGPPGREVKLSRQRRHP